MTLLGQFKEFVDSKPASAGIDNSEAWYKCAIGEFSKHLGRDDTYLSPFALEVCGGRTELYCMLNSSDFQTYGELQSYLANEVV